MARSVTEKDNLNDGGGGGCCGGLTAPATVMILVSNKKKQSILKFYVRAISERSGELTPL